MSLMKSETKLFLGIILGTIALVAVGIAFLSRSAAPVKVDSTILVRSDSNKIATGSGAITLVEFSDFQCPACGAYYAPVKQLVSEFASSMTFVYRNYPLTNTHKNAQIGAQAAEAAGLQGKFWEMHDMLFEKQTEWSTLPDPRPTLMSYAESLKLDTAQFTKDIDSDTVKNKIQKDVDDGNALGINGTPTFFLAGEKLENPASIDDFRALIKAAIDKAPKPSVTGTQAYHVHANLKVFVNGTAIDFALPKYQGVDGKDLNEDIHFHDNKGDLIHIHKTGVSLGTFFTSLKMKLTKNALSDDVGTVYGVDSTHTLRMFVNGKENAQLDRYVPQDLDRILITYGSSDAAIQTQLSSIPDDACIYSLKCPERGKPPTENCVGGLGTDCKD